MNRKHRHTFRSLTFVAAGAALASIAVLWVWNTLVPLFGGPIFEFRHAVALVIGLITIRVVLGRGVRHHRHKYEEEVHL